MAADDVIAGNWVFVPSAALLSIRLRHQFSETDPGVGGTGRGHGTTAITGVTRWIGSWQDASVTVGWDWAALQGAIVLVNPADIRTNLRLVGTDGREESRGMASIHLYHWVESQPWREIGILDVLKNIADKNGQD